MLIGAQDSTLKARGLSYHSSQSLYPLVPRIFRQIFSSLLTPSSYPSGEEISSQSEYSLHRFGVYSKNLDLLAWSIPRDPCGHHIHYARNRIVLEGLDASK